jgi:hypothetical protein
MAFNFQCYSQGIQQLPPELDIVEWHYLLKYFSTAKFKVCSTLLLLLTNTQFIQMAMSDSLRFFVHNFTLYRKGPQKILRFKANK